MTHTSAQKSVLITHAGSFLGVHLAKSFLGRNCLVYGLGDSSLPQELLLEHNFTLLEFDFAQPLPSHLPQFDMIFYLETQINNREQENLASPQVPTLITNLLSFAKKGNSQLFICAHITSDTRLFSHLTRDSHVKNLLKLFQIGDLYGPNMPLSRLNPKSPEINEIALLISQALDTDKIVLKEEGLKIVYPTYITDAVFAINKLAFWQHTKEIETIVSETPRTSLSVAYEIQNIASVVLNKELSLFFAGEKPKEQVSQEEKKIDNLHFDPQTKLTEGLKNTLQALVTAKVPGDHKDFESQDTHKNHQQLLKSILELKSQASQKTKEQIPLSSKLPIKLIKSRAKLILIAIVVFFSLTICKTGLDLYLGVTSLKASREAVFSGDLEKSKEKAGHAETSFRRAHKKVKVIAFPFSLISKRKAPSYIALLESASIGSSSLKYFVQGSEVLIKDFSVILKKDIKKEGFDLEQPAASLKRAYFESSQAKELAAQARLLNPNSETIQKAQDALGSLNELSSSMFELTNLTNNLTGQDTPKTYLVLLQNNTELRPGGGFIGNFGLIEFDQGRLQNISVEDIYTIDGQLQEKIEPPKELKEKLGVDKFYLRDSNWSGDYSLNAQTARDFYKKETGQNVDGVIAVDLTFIQEVLKKIGPVMVDDYNEKISAENLFERGEYYSEVGFFPGSTQKRDFFGALSRELINKMFAGDQGLWFSLFVAAKEGISQKHTMVVFDDTQLSSFVHTHGWDHPLPPYSFNPQDDSGATRDFLAIVEANLGANKVNRFLERKISYEMTIGKDADLVAKLKITYTNKSQAETWPAGNYTNFLRVYVPPSAGLFEHQNGQDTDISKVEVTNQTNLTAFATFVEVPIKSTKEVTFTYRIPKNINLEKAPTYQLYVQKQAGTEKDLFEFTFNLPNYLKEKDSGKQNLKITSDLATDREFAFELVKK